MKQQAKDLLQLEDCGQFLSRYGGVIQSLDAAYNNLELLTADAEDRLSKLLSEKQGFHGQGKISGK